MFRHPMLLSFLVACLCLTLGCSSVPRGLPSIDNEHLNHLVLSSANLENECAKLYEVPYEERRFDQLVIFKRLAEISEEADELFRAAQLSEERRRELLEQMFREHGIPITMTKYFGDKILDSEMARLFRLGKANMTALWKVQPGILANEDPQNPLLLTLNQFDSD